MLSEKMINAMCEEAQAGDSELCVSLSIKYEHGLDIEIDKGKALYWLEMAAKYGNAWAIYNLGECNESGRLVGKKDLQKAFFYYQSALKHEFMGAVSKLAYFYEYGLVGERNFELAFIYTEMDADINNSPWAKVHLARMYDLGVGCVSNHENMNQYLDKGIASFMQYEIGIDVIRSNAVNQKDVVACEVMGYIYRFGFFAVNVDLEVANYWFSEAEAIKAEIVGQNQV